MVSLDHFDITDAHLVLIDCPHQCRSDPRSRVFGDRGQTGRVEYVQSERQNPFDSDPQPVGQRSRMEGRLE